MKEEEEVVGPWKAGKKSIFEVGVLGEGWILAASEAGGGRSNKGGKFVGPCFTVFCTRPQQPTVRVGKQTTSRPIECTQASKPPID